MAAVDRDENTRLSQGTNDGDDTRALYLGRGWRGTGTSTLAPHIDNVRALVAHRESGGDRGGRLDPATIAKTVRRNVQNAHDAGTIERQASPDRWFGVRGKRRHRDSV